MKIRMHRFLHASADSFLTIDESLLKKVNKELARDYVLANNLSEVPQIKSVEMLETLLKEYDSNEKYTNDCDIVFRGLIKEDGTVDRGVHYESLYDIVYDLVINYLDNEPFEIYNYDTINYHCEVGE